MDYNKALRIICSGIFTLFISLWIAFAIPMLSHSTLAQITSLDNHNSWPLLDIVFWVLTLLVITAVQFYYRQRRRIKNNLVLTTQALKEDFVETLYLNIMRMTIATVIMYYWRDDYAPFINWLTS